MSVQNDGEKCAQKAGWLRGGAVDVFIDPRSTNVVVHVVFLHCGFN